MTKTSWQQFISVGRSAVLNVSWPLFAVLSLGVISQAFATIDNTVTVTGSSPTGSNDVIATADETVDVVDALNELTIIKTAILNDETLADGFAEEGETITYTFDVTNSGNVTLTNVIVNDTTNATNGPVIPTDEIIFIDGGAATSDSTDATIDGSWDALAPGDTIRFSATYTVTQTDVDTLN